MLQDPLSPRNAPYDTEGSISKVFFCIYEKGNVLLYIPNVI